MDRDDVFEMTKEHLRLMRAGVFSTGPNSDFNLGRSRSGRREELVPLILGLDPDDVTPRQMRELTRLLASTATALRVVLATGRFDPGIYHLRDRHDPMSWVPGPAPERWWWVNSPNGPVRVDEDVAQDDVDCWSTLVGEGP